MGFEIEFFVHPERISSQLICLICQGVLERPVQTPTDHLFCEDELLEWMTRSNRCPITNQVLDPDSIRKPSRIILNMLGELERFCSYKSRGCSWQGPCESVKLHEKSCDRRPIDEILQQLQSKNEQINHLQQRITTLEKRNGEYEGIIRALQERNHTLESKLKVYDAFVVEKGSYDSSSKQQTNQISTETDLQRIARLRRFGQYIDENDIRKRNRAIFNVLALAQTLIYERCGELNEYAKFIG
eukprot:gene10198-21259_t